MVPGPFGFGVLFAYLAIGAVLAAAFLLRGIERLDAGAQGAYGFRVLIFPGLVLLWPVVAWRWSRAGGGGAH